MIFQHLRKALRINNPPITQRFNLSLTQKLFFSARAKPNSDDANGRSLTASYLVSALGLSSESALAATRTVPAVNPYKAAVVIHALEEQGFTPSQIAAIVSRCPRALSPRSLKTILPKIDFLRSRGASSADITTIIRRSPRILDRSLERQIVPAFEIIRDFLGSEPQTIVTLTRCASLWFLHSVKILSRNSSALTEAGVPIDKVRFMLLRYPNCLLASQTKFDLALERVKSVDADPRKFRFVISLCVMLNLAESTWKKKVSTFRRLGWSEEDADLAFKRFPYCMSLSEKNLTETMEFFVNEMGLESTYFVRNPLLLSLSLKNRIVPRCTVIQVLISKKLIKRFSLTSVLMTNYMRFVKKFISPYSVEHPSLASLYQEASSKGKIT